MKVFLFLVPVFLFFVSGPVFSEKIADVRQQTWYTYSNQTRFTEKSGIWVDLQTEVIPKTFVLLNDELHINARKNVKNNYFDQNRLFAGVRHQYTPDLNAHAGYLYVFQQLRAGNGYIHINAFRLFAFQNLHLQNN